MSIAIHESDPLAADPERSDSGAVTRQGPAGLDREGQPSTEPERFGDLEVRLAIQTIASRILAAALIERAQEAESIAT